MAAAPLSRLFSFSPYYARHSHARKLPIFAMMPRDAYFLAGYTSLLEALSPGLFYGKWNALVAMRLLSLFSAE